MRLESGAWCVSTPGIRIPGSRLPSLRWLNLWNTFITDEGVAQLKDAKGLEYLNLEGTGVSFEVVDELKEALPKLQVEIQ